MQRTSGTTLKVFGTLILALSLGACGRKHHRTTEKLCSPLMVKDSAVSPTEAANIAALKSLKAQTINWAACDPTIVPYNVVKQTIGARLQCADITVPEDWNKPSRGNLSFSLLRVTAGDPAKRQGSLFFNPGGPGGDGLLFGAIYGYLWNQADTSTPTGKQLFDLSEQYDLIGFSPRGTGQSSRLTCGSNVSSSPEQYQTTDRSQKNIDAMLRNARIVAEACLKNPLTPYINTDQTARDLDLARELMGDKKFNFIGYSYGTWLGSWYAKLFPEQTGRMLLDGNTAFAGTFQDSFNMQPLGFQRAFTDSALAYIARHPVFEMGTSEPSVYAIYDAFAPAIKLALQTQDYENNIIQSLYSDFTIPTISVSLVGARGLNDVVAANPGLNTEADLTPLLEKHTFAKDANLDAAARADALTLLPAYLGVINQKVKPVDLKDDNAVFNSVINNDTPWNQDPQFWINFGAQQAVANPLVGGGFTETSAIYWSKPTTTKPPVPAGLPPILMLQNELDPATPKEGALDALKSLPSAKMIFVDNEAQHTAFPYGDTCVDSQVAQYFLDGSMPANKFNVCQALPLPGLSAGDFSVPAETRVYQVGDTYANGNTVPAQSLAAQGIRSQALGNTPATKDALNLLKAIIERNAIKPPQLR